MRSYPHIDNIPTNLKKAKIFLNTKLYWTFKEDGSNIGIGKIDNKIVIRSRDKEPASEDLQKQVKDSEDFINIEKALKENLYLQFFVESCRKGRSITGTKEYPRNMLICFDIWNNQTNKFLSYPKVKEICEKYNIPYVELFKISKHKNYSSLKKLSNFALKYSKEICLEGMVVKTDPDKVSHPEPPFYMEYCQFKTKLDVPEMVIQKIARGEIVYPDMPESEIWSSINRAWEELGTEKFLDKKIAMPIIAKYIQESSKLHCYKFPVKLYHFYNAYIERHLGEQS